MATEQSTNFFSRALYDRLKFVAQILLPAIASLWFAVGGIWNLPYTTQVVGTITTIDLFLGTILQISSNAYYRNERNFDGEVEVSHDEDGEPKAKFVFDESPAIIADDPGKHSLEYKVKHVDEPKH